MAKKASLLEIVYRIGVIIKGVDGAFELIAGLILWLAPGLLHTILAPIRVTDSDDKAIHVFISDLAGRLDDSIASGPQAIVILFLLTHGVVKLALVYCLLKEYVWAYPYALAILGAFAVYQIYIFAAAPSFGLAFFVVLDIVIIALVWREWRVLRRLPQKR